MKNCTLMQATVSGHLDEMMNRQTHVHSKTSYNSITDLSNWFERLSFKIMKHFDASHFQKVLKIPLTCVHVVFIERENRENYALPLQFHLPLSSSLVRPTAYTMFKCWTKKAEFVLDFRESQSM